MNAKIVIAVLVICSCAALGQQPVGARAQDKNQPANPTPAASTNTSPKKVRVDRQGFDLDPKKSKGQNSPQIGAGTRGGQSAVVLYAPSLGLTYTLQPVFCWERQSGAQKLTFRLHDSEDVELYETEVTGHSSFSYPPDAPQLKVGATYLWTIQTEGVLSEPPEPARLIVLSDPERQEVRRALQNSAENTMGAKIQRAQIFVDHWLWYDAVAAFSELISAYPGDPVLYQYRGNIYNDLPQTHQLAQQDFARSGEILAGTGHKQQLSELKHGTYYALVVGIDHYQNEPQLRTPLSDAKEVDEVLRTLYGFNTQLLLDATRAQILKALESYKQSLKEEDSLLIYYAGHGNYDETAKSAYWAPVDAGQNDYSQWIIAAQITSTVTAIPARHVLIVSDSCYSGMLSDNVRSSLAPIGPAVERAVLLERMLGKRSRQILASGGKEPVQDADDPGRSSNHSVFANALLQALKEFQANEFLGDELFQYVRVLVAGRAGQTPEYSIIPDPVHHEGGDFVLARVSEHAIDVEPSHVVIPPPPPPPPANPAKEGIDFTLGNYEAAYSSKDIDKMKQVWPSMSLAQEGNIKKFFGFPGVTKLEVQLRNCSTTFGGDTAHVTCDQWMVLTYRKDPRPPRTDPVEILLSKNANGSWLVTSVKGR